MGPTMEIDILEIHKSKKKYYVLIFDLKMFITFVNDVKLQNFDLVSKFQFLAHICGVIVEKLKGGLRRVKFWYFF